MAHPRQSDSAERRLGTVVADAFKLVRHMASGGSSHVFEAEHLRLGRRFAVKLLREELDTTRATAQRFRREARAIARLRSDHVVQVVDCGELDDRTPYLVMDLLQGEDLRSLLNRETRLPTRRAVPLIIQACRGVSAVHAAGLVHRDLKPENLFVTQRETGEDCCKILDFGVAKMDASLTTTPGIIVGTVRYMAPEQLVDGAAVDARADVYALGAILYECLTGRPAHAGETVQQVMYSVMNEARQSLAELERDLPAGLVEAVTRALNKDPAQRPASAKEYAAMLQRASLRTRDSIVESTLAEGTPLAHAAPTARLARWRLALSLLVTTAVAGASAFAYGKQLGIARSAALHAPAPQPTARSTAVDASVNAPLGPAKVALVRATPSTNPEPSARTQAPTPTKAARSKPSTAKPRTEDARVSIGDLDHSNPYGE